jgi:hypothetical protein
MRKLVATIGRSEGMVVLVGRPDPRMGLVLRSLAARLTADFTVVSVRSRPGSGLDELLDACTAAHQRELADAADASSGEHATGEKRATVILVEDGETLTDGTLAELARLAQLAKDRARPLRVVLAGSPELGPRVERLELPLGGMVHAETCRIDGASVGSDQRRWLLAGAGGLIAAGFAALILTGESSPPRVSFEAVPQPASTPSPLHSSGAGKPTKRLPAAPIAPAPSPTEPAGRDLASLLARAERQIAAGKLDAPEDDNAFRTYQEIVILAPEDTAGTHLLSLIRETYLDQAREAEQRGDSESALRFRDTARLLTPERAALIAQSRQ